MAKEDFCFTYYDGDAARDKAHMTRLERGAYDDIISAQRKFGRLSPDKIRRVLGSDFDACWPSLEWILKKDEDGNFYIEWLEKSVSKMRESSKKQREKIEGYWEDVKAGKIQRKNHGNTAVLPQNEKNDTVVIPLENENGYIEETIDSKIFDLSTKTVVKGAKKKFVAPTLDEFRAYWEDSGYSPEVAVRAWTGYHEAGWKDSRGSPIRNWKQKCQHVWFKPEHKINGTHFKTPDNQSKLGTSAARVEALKNW